MSNENKLGTDMIKKTIKFLYDTGTEGIEILADKKIVLGEVLGLGDNLYSGITLFMKWPELVAQAKDVDSEEGGNDYAN